MKGMFKIGLVGLLASSLFAGETQIGHGTFKMSGGFVGLDQTIKTNVTTYSLVEHHKNIFSSKWFYNYNFTWYDSDNMVQAQNGINSLSTPIKVPSIDYRVQGLDANMALGKDLLHEDENNNLGLGLLLGVSIPWIDSKKSDSNDNSTSNKAMNTMKDSKTELYTYKVGLTLSGTKSLNRFFMLYGSGTYAYQTGILKNSYANSDSTVNGMFQEYDVGLKFQPISEDYEFGWFTLSPRVYATLGYRYSSWDLNDVKIDVTGQNTTFAKTDFNMNSSVTYFGFGYSF